MGKPFNASPATIDAPPTKTCLFLVVYCPESIFKRRSKNQSSSMPVLVCIYCEGYTTGEKITFDARGLIIAS